MKLKTVGLYGIELIPETKQEAQILEAWSLSPPPRIGMTVSDMWSHYQMSINFQVEKGLAYKQEIEKSVRGF